MKPMREMLSVLLSAALMDCSVPPQEIDVSWMTDLLGELCTTVSCPIWLFCPSGGRKCGGSKRRNNRAFLSQYIPRKESVFESQCEEEAEKGEGISIKYVKNDNTPFRVASHSQPTHAKQAVEKE
jgi:hypothetical protein